MMNRMSAETEVNKGYLLLEMVPVDNAGICVHILSPLSVHLHVMLRKAKSGFLYVRVSFDRWSGMFSFQG